MLAPERLPEDSRPLVTAKDTPAWSEGIRVLSLPDSRGRQPRRT